jgi:hypothetical protein
MKAANIFFIFFESPQTQMTSFFNFCAKDFIDFNPTLARVCEVRYINRLGHESVRLVFRPADLENICPRPSHNFYDELNKSKLVEASQTISNALIVLPPVSNALIVAPPWSDEFMQQHFRRNNHHHRRRYEQINICCNSRGKIIFTGKTAQPAEQVFDHLETSSSSSMTDAEIEADQRRQLAILEKLLISQLAKALRDEHPDRDLVEFYIETGNYTLISELYMKMFRARYGE